MYTGVIEKDSYIIKKVIYQSLPNFYVTSNLYLPKEIDKNFLPFYLPADIGSGQRVVQSIRRSVQNLSKMVL